MKRAILKAFIAALLIASPGLYNKAFGQVTDLDPAITALSFSNGTLPQGDGHQTLTLNFNVGPATTTSSKPIGGIQIQLSFPTQILPFPQGVGAVQATGISSKFNWVYNAGTRTLTGTSNEVIADDDDGLITFNVEAQTNTGGQFTVQANILYPPEGGGNPAGNLIGNDEASAGAFNGAPASPVTLISFNAIKEGQAAVLNWSTSEETDSDRFEIEHSLNAKNWQKIGTVLSKGDSKNLERYLFTDTNPANGLNYYRLRMVDRDGSFAHTLVKSLEFEIKMETALYPNPVADRLLIKAQDMTKIKSVSLVNLQGKVVLESSTVPTNGLDVMSLPTGLYVVQVVNTNGSVNSFKIMKN